MIVVVVLAIWLVGTQYLLQPQDPTEKSILLFDGVCNLCDGVGKYHVLDGHAL